MSNDGNAVWQDNIAAFRRDLDALGRSVFPKVFATALNRAAFETKGHLVTYTKTAIASPNKFTTDRSWRYRKAKASDGDRMFAEIYANEKQAQYLWFLVFGGTRVPGDAATNAKFGDMFAWSESKTAFGGIDRKAIKKLARGLKTEKKRRNKYADKRRSVLAEGLSADKQHKKLSRLRWSYVSKNAPGYFLGTIHGVKGYWQRPERYTAEERSAVIETHRAGAVTPSGTSSRLPFTKPGSKPELLVALARDTKYKKTFDFFGQVEKSFHANMTPAKLQASLTYELDKLNRRTVRP